MNVTDRVRQAIENYLAGHSQVITAVAAKEIEGDLPDRVLRDWLWERRYDVLGGYIAAVSRATGSRQASERRHRIFAEASAELEEAIADSVAGHDERPIQEFFRMYHCGNRDGQAVRKRLGDMNHEEIEFHRNRQQNNVRYYQRRVRFLTKIQARLGDGQVVGDIFTPDELDRVLASIR